ncbi:transposase [Streptomyces sp. SAI-041]|nr:transposase [Streptomyces sp. SAI-041]
MTLSAIPRMLHRHGFSHQLPARRAVKRDEEAVAGWGKETWSQVEGPWRRLTRLADTHDWIGCYFLPAYAPDLKPLEGIWSLLRRSSQVNTAFTDSDHLIKKLRHGLRQIQYRSNLIDGCLAETGLTLTTSCFDRASKMPRACSRERGRLAHGTMPPQPHHHGGTMRTTVTLAATAAALLALTACSLGDDSAEPAPSTSATVEEPTTTPTNTPALANDEENLARVVDTYTSLYFAGEGEPAYVFLSKRCKAKADPAVFEATVEQAAKDYGSDHPATDVRATVSGDMGRVSYRVHGLPKFDQQAQPWTREGGDWKYDAC